MIFELIFQCTSERCSNRPTSDDLTKCLIEPIAFCLRSEPRGKLAPRFCRSLAAMVPDYFLKDFLLHLPQNECYCVCARGDSDGAAEIIDRWVANKMTGIISPDDVNRLARLVVVSTVYFNGDWLKKFNASFTHDAQFHVSSYEAVKIDLMYTKSNFSYGRSSELNSEAIELRYAGGDLSMFVLLPDQASSLAQLEDKLTAADLVNVERRFAMRSAEVGVRLPRFKLDEMLLSLAEKLSAMGMPDLFTEGVADLSGVDGSNDLYVDMVIHRAVVDVNEEGTEAAAAAGAVEIFSTSFRQEETHFRADRPFFFFIRHKPSRSVLFLGRLVKPPHASVIYSKPATSGATDMATIATTTALSAVLFTALTL